MGRVRALREYHFSIPLTYVSVFFFLLFLSRTRFPESGNNANAGVGSRKFDVIGRNSRRLAPTKKTLENLKEDDTVSANVRGALRLRLVKDSMVLREILRFEYCKSLKIIGITRRAARCALRLWSNN